MEIEKYSRIILGSTYFIKNEYKKKKNYIMLLQHFE
jgi:hypothetical protein